jgi:hypothetical protein
MREFATQNIGIEKHAEFLKNAHIFIVDLGLNPVDFDFLRESPPPPPPPPPPPVPEHPIGRILKFAGNVPRSAVWEVYEQLSRSKEKTLQWQREAAGTGSPFDVSSQVSARLRNPHQLQTIQVWKYFAQLSNTRSFDRRDTDPFGHRDTSLVIEWHMNPSKAIACLLCVIITIYSEYLICGQRNETEEKQKVQKWKLRRTTFRVRIFCSIF